jgi:hypothetical protein
MEKFRIAQYGFIQMVALAYGILTAGAVVKISKQTWADTRTHLPPPFFDSLAAYRDYGLLFSLVIIIWAAFCAYHSTTFSKLNINEDTIVASGIVLAGIFFVSGTAIMICGMTHLFPPISAY